MGERHEEDRVRDCQRLADAVAWVQGELGPAERERYERHMPSCAACQAFVHDTRRILSLLAPAPEPARRAGVAPGLAVAALLAAAALALFTLWFPFPGPAPAADVASQQGVPAQPAFDPRALDWVASHLGDDGTWPASSWLGPAADDVAMHAFALLALARGVELHPDAERLARLRAAAEWLVARQADDGSIGLPLADGHFGHPVATLALLEAWRSTGDAALRAAAERAVVSLAASDPVRHARRPGANAGQVAWAVAALEQARGMGLCDGPEVDRVRASLGPQAALAMGSDCLDREPFWALALGRSEPPEPDDWSAASKVADVNDLYSASLAVLAPAGRSIWR